MQQRSKTADIILAYLPAILMAVAAVATVVLCLVFRPGEKPTTYIGIAVVTLVSPLLIFLNRRLRLGVPYWTVVLICIHLASSVFLGTALGIYRRIAWWDLYVHGLFGFLACAVLYYLYLRFEHRQPSAVHLVAIVLIVIACAAIWEMYEYVADLLLHGDMQRVETALELGISPVEDTMTDLLIAIPGALLFLPVAIIRPRLSKDRKDGGQ